MKRRVTAGVAVLGLLATGLLPAPAALASVNKCSMQLGAVTAGGDHRGLGISATSPPTLLGDTVGPRDLYPDGLATFSGAMATQPMGPGEELRGGWLVLRSSLYLTGYITGSTGEQVGPATLKRISGDWQGYTAFQTSRYYEGPAYRHLRMTQYALRYDGVLVRWTVQGNSWVDPQMVAGFSSVKTMTLISQSRTYDTFLANTQLGALYTIRIPTTSPMVPVVKPLRSTSWQRFDTLVAERCGANGTLLLGIDQDTHTGRLYAISHADGTDTVIDSLGEVPLELTDPVYFRWYRDTPQTPRLNGD